MNIPHRAADKALSIKILGIGNSFSQDAMYYLYKIFKDMGYEKIIIGNLIIGGCSLSTHAINIKNNSPAYIYEKKHKRQLAGSV